MGATESGTQGWGGLLRAHRLRAALTQEDLARISGVSVRGIRLIENGERRPRAATVTTLADALRLSETDKAALLEAVRPPARPAGEPRVVLPRQLPPPPHGFAARQAEIARLDSDLSGTGNLLGCVTGTGGVGKTWLAVHWASRHAGRFPDGQLYVNLRGFDPVAEPVSTPSALRSLTVGLGVPAAELPSDVDDLAALFRSVVAGRRMLVLLDNARDAAQVEPLLPGGTDCVTLVTSRSSLRELAVGRGARLLRLDSLTDAAAAQVLALRLGAERVEREPAAVATLVSACAGLPLALGIVAAQACRYPDHPLRTFADELTAAEPYDGGEVAQRLGQLIEGSLRWLSPSAARLFWLLGLTPGDGLTGYTAASVAGEPVTSARATLRELDDAHLIEQDVPSHYRMHDLTFEYAARHAESHVDEADRGSAAHRLVDHYVLTAYAASRALRRPFDPPGEFPIVSGSVGTPFDDRDSALAWQRAEESNLPPLQAMALSHGWYESAWRLADAMRIFGHEATLSATVERALWRGACEAAPRLSPRQRVQAHRLYGKSVMNTESGNAAAIRELQKALRIVRVHDVAGELASTHYTLSYVFQSAKQHEAALKHAQDAHVHWDAADRPSAYVRSHLLTCWILGDLGRHDEARAEGEAGRVLARDSELGYLEAMALNLLGANERKAGNHREAEELLRRADELHRQRGERTVWMEINLDDLGDVLHAQGRDDEAAEAWRRSLELSEAAYRFTSAEKVRAKIARLGPAH